jgi:hypothetical protein
MTAIAIALASVLLALAALHMFWAIRNRFEGSSVVIPKVGDRPVFTPSRTATLAVACALGAGAFVALAQGHALGFAAPPPVRWAAYAAGFAFTARAIGDFRLVGFFKRIKGTDFARWDYYLFAPLSALIGISFLSLAHC